MATHLQWLSALALFATASGCTLAKSVGDDPMMVEGASSSTTSGGPAGGAGSLSATSGNPTAGGATATSTSGGSPGFPGPDACGIEPVPEGLPGYYYSYTCEGGCVFNYVVPLPLDEDAGECLCEAAGCGPYAGDEVSDDEEEGGVGTDDYNGTCEVEIMPNDGPGYYEFTCDCDICSVDFQDIHPDSVDALFDNLTACECLCLEAGCGYHDGGAGGGVEGGDAKGESDGGPGPTTGGG